MKACSTTISNEAILNETYNLLPLLIEWFVELDGNNETTALQVPYEMANILIASNLTHFDPVT